MHHTKQSVTGKVHGIFMVHFRERGDCLAGLTQTFDDLNGDEGDFIQIASQIEQAFPIRVDLADLQSRAPSNKPVHFLFLSAEIVADYTWNKLSAT